MTEIHCIVCSVKKADDGEALCYKCQKTHGICEYCEECRELTKVKRCSRCGSLQCNLQKMVRCTETRYNYCYQCDSYICTYCYNSKLLEICDCRYY